MATERSLLNSKYHIRMVRPDLSVESYKLEILAANIFYVVRVTNYFFKVCRMGRDRAKTFNYVDYRLSPFLMG